MVQARFTHFPMIDVLRGFAALSVLVYHVIEHFRWTAFPDNGPLVWFRLGWQGVDLFFVISGFVIALSAFALIDRVGESGFRLPFLLRRLARIVPLHYLTCFVFVAFIAPGLILHPGIWAHFVSHLLFFHNLSTEWQGSINGVNWSLGTEMQFYLLILVLAPWLRRCRWWLIPALALPVTWAWRAAAVALVPIDGPAGPFPLFVAATQLPGMLDEFAAGILLARALRSDAALGRLRIAFRLPVLPILAAAAACWGTLSLFWPHASYWDHPGMVIFWRTALAASCGLVVLAACCLRGQPVLRLTWPLRYLGTISYGIYLWHLPVIESVKRVTWIGPDTALWLVLGLTVLLAAGSWHFFESGFVKRVHGMQLRMPGWAWPVRAQLARRLA
ncbi:acyltransferase family protein [Roseicella aquatilis]|uniref:Acyltransferase n=1 Tax=Roseicella aquatilis TaxID=2527868 RepID=A0A4R4DTG7_9PROT|nr:acyltransferase [Roseicella aquatilis]TCZ66129.1 acyltransferase [Roseicella aquatilis]